MSEFVLRDRHFSIWNLVPLSAGFCAAVLGLAVVMGWHLDLPAVVQVGGALEPMHFNTAICLFLLGSALISACLMQTRAPVPAGVFAASVGVLTSLEYLADVDLGIQSLLFEPSNGSHIAAPGGMAPNTAICLVMAGIATALMGYRLRHREPSSLSIILGALTVAIGLAAAAGYLAGLEFVYGWGQFEPMALHTALGFVALGLGITVFHWPRPVDGLAVDLQRITGMLISLTTLGVLLVVTLAAAIALIPLYEQLRENRNREVRQELTAEVSAIESLLSRTASLAQRLGDDWDGQWRRADSGLSGDSIQALEKAHAALDAWDGPGRLHLGVVRPDGPRLLRFAEGERTPRFDRASGALANAIASGMSDQRGLLSDFGRQERTLHFYAPVEQTPLVLVVSVAADDLYAEADQRLLLVGFIVLLVALVGALGIARLLRPLTNGFLIHSRDLNERVRSATRDLHQSLEKLQRTNQDLEHFAYVVSHDLQAPLRGVDGFADILHKRYGDRLGDDGVEFIDLIKQAAAQMRAFIQGLLELSRIDSRAQPLSPVNTDEVVERAIRHLKFVIEDDEADVRVDDDLPMVMGDAMQLLQLFQNLIDNAIKFRHPNRKPVVRISVTPQDGGWEFAIADNGIGVNPDQRERVFEIFQRADNARDRQGTGIGLAVCRRIVHRHGGSIWLDPAHTEGTCIRFTLRAVPEADSA